MKKLILSVLCGLFMLMSANAKSIVIYFSRADENYGVGTITKGNTQVLAEIIASETNSEQFKIERVAAYPKDYSTCIKEAKDEMNKNLRPQIKATMTQTQLDEYDTIYFGSPVWWGDLPMPVYTFIESLNWNGKKVYFFGTHEGSGANGIASSFKKAAKGCDMQKNVLSMSGRNAQKNDEAERKAVKEWIR